PIKKHRNFLFSEPERFALRRTRGLLSFYKMRKRSLNTGFAELSPFGGFMAGSCWKCQLIAKITK
ncbi:MAG: hypothetical protein CO162_06815, partial [bacterium (Candidatus Ratteibacteria) CG_4_9_14_3_um_filter_41_21]